MGAGSCTELLAFSDCFKNISTTHNIFDIHDWSELIESVKADFKVNFKMLDLLEYVPLQVCKANLVTFMYILVELFKIDEENAKRSISNIMHNMKPGSFILFGETKQEIGDILVEIRSIGLSESFIEHVDFKAKVSNDSTIYVETLLLQKK